MNKYFQNLPKVLLRLVPPGILKHLSLNVFSIDLQT